MRLYFLRHGSAEDRREGLRDYDRRLTTEGIAEMQRVAVGLARAVPEVDLIVTSPLPRALETARIAEAALRVKDGPLVVSEKLSSGAFGIAEVQELVRSLPSSHRVILVGHEPDFSSTVRDLTGAIIDMKKAGVALVETNRVERGAGVLRWLLTPRHLELMAGSRD
jgi:phosphohistidine phosphatase